LGNGFLGAMIFGGTLMDRYQMNQDSLYSGGRMKARASK
jgi:alpha-L-fucosidase 2